MVQQATKYYERLFQTKAEGLIGEIAKYYHKRSPFEPNVFEDRQLTNDPGLFWELFKNAAPALSALAIRLFAICMDSEGVAQVMDELNWVHDLRTLHPDKVCSCCAAVLDMQLRSATDKWIFGSFRRLFVPNYKLAQIALTTLSRWKYPD